MSNDGNKAGSKAKQPRVHIHTFRERRLEPWIVPFLYFSDNYFVILAATSALG
jgi:hypothetical protein